MMMKKIISMLLTIGLAIGWTTGTYAQTISDPKLGISFSLSDDWNSVSEDGLAFQNQSSSDEWLYIVALEADGIYSLDSIEEAQLKDMCEALLSNENISRSLSESNGSLATMSVDSVISSYEYHNSVLYYRYEKAFTGHAFGYKDTPFYYTEFVTAKNGMLYMIIYHRNYDENHYAEVAAMLDTLSFELGEIKIVVNGERIYPDSSPMLIADRTMVPIRAIAEKLGYTVDWDEETQRITMVSGDSQNVLLFAVGEYMALKNFATEMALEVPPIIIGDRTYLPLRAAAEAMDAQVTWEEATKTANIWK